MSHGLCGPEKKTPFLALLEEHLGRHSFLLSTSSGHSLADVAVFDAIQQPKVASEAVKYKNVCRWARLMGECLNVSLEMKISQQPTVFPLLEASGVSSSSSSSEKKEAEKKEVPQMSEKQIAKQKEKAAKKEKAAAATNKKEETKAGSDEMDPSKLDFRVGLVKKCWPHPEAEKLLCEEIDMGNGEQRQIASGIKAFYKPEEVQGRKVIVLCNLKDRNLVGFKSQGMVICASNSDHTDVKLLEPPAGAQPGDHVSFPGFGLEDELKEGGKRREPASSAQVAKKKILEKLAPDLKTDSNGVAHWRSSPFTVGTHGTVGSGLSNAVVG